MSTKEAIINAIINFSNNEAVVAVREFCNDHPILLGGLLAVGFVWAISDEIIGDLRSLRARCVKN